MPRIPVENKGRMSFRNVTAGKPLLEQSERLNLSERDSLLVLDLLENSPEPNEKLMAAAFAMPKVS